MLPIVKQTFEWVDFKFSDLLFANSPILRFFTGKPEIAEHPVVIVNKDQTFFQRFQRDPDRSDFAALTGYLNQQGAKVVVYDFIFAEPGDAEKDQQLASAIASISFPLLATHFVGRGTQTFEKVDLADSNASRPPWPTPVFDLLSRQAARTALINLVADFDSTIRFAPLAFHPADMEEFIPSLAYSAWIASMIEEESSTIQAEIAKHKNLSPENTIASIIKAGKYRFYSTGHPDIDRMTRRLEAVFLTRLIYRQFPELKESLLGVAHNLNVSALPDNTWLRMPEHPLPIIGNYHMPCLRLPFNKLSPPFKGDGIPVLSMGTLLETDSDKASTLLNHRLTVNIESSSAPLNFKLPPPTTATGNAQINGRVLNQQQQPVNKAQILFFMPQTRFWITGESAADGSFCLQGLPAGDFNLQISQNHQNGWIKGSMHGTIEREILQQNLPDLIFPAAEAEATLTLPASGHALTSIAIFGEPIPMIKSDSRGTASQQAIPANYTVAGLDENVELTFQNGKLITSDQQPAGNQIAALLSDNSPWLLRFLFQQTPQPGQSQIRFSELPTALDARIAVFSAIATATGQPTEDLVIFPGKENAITTLPQPTRPLNEKVEVCFSSAEKDPVQISLFSETGEKISTNANQNLSLQPGKYLVFTRQQEKYGMLTPGSLNSPVVFFGSALPQDQDFIVTPINFMDRSLSRIPGVNLHATLFSALKRQSFIRAIPGHSDQNPVAWPIFQTLLLLPLLAMLNLVFVKSGALWGGVSVGLATLLWLSAGTALFLHQWLLPMFFPVLQLLSFGALRGYMSWIIARQQEKETRQTFGRFISPAVVEDILRTPDSLKPGGEKKELSIIFTDLAGFTSISEKLEPEQLTELMNEYLDEMTRILFQFGGTLDKYIGDAIMGFWNHPKAQPDHAQRSVDCAIHMQKRLKVLREKWIKQGLPKVEVRAGMNSAVCMVGFIGSDIQMNFTCLGDGVNLASRLEGANKAYGTYIMISESVHRQIDRNSISTRFLDFLAVKGKEKPMEVFEVRGYRNDEPQEWSQAEKSYQQGIQQYLAREWDAAIAAFSAVMALLPEDGPSAVYIERCKEFKKSPPPENWDGRYILKSK